MSLFPDLCNPQYLSLADSATLTNLQIRNNAMVVMTVTAKTLTLPAPSQGTVNHSFIVANHSVGNLTLACADGFLYDEDSITIASGHAVLVACRKIASSSYRYTVIGVSAPYSDEVMADLIGSMVTSNTETGLTVTYQDGDNTLDFALGTHTHADAANGGQIAAAGISDATATPTLSKIPIADGSAHLDGWISAATAATPGLVEHADWAAWTPTFTWSIAPATPVVVARHQHVGNMVTVYIDWSTADGNDGVLSAVTLPHAPVDVNAYIPVKAHLLVDTTWSQPVVQVDATSSPYNIIFKTTITATDTKAVQLLLSVSYEVAAT